MIIIVGLGTASVYATRWITALNREEEVTIVEQHSYESYSPCSMPMIFEQNKSYELIKHPFPRTRRINLLLEHYVESIDNIDKKVVVKNIKNGETMTLSYTTLFYAAGADPFIPPIKNVKEFIGKGVFFIKTIEDMQRIEKYLSENQASNVSVIGAGAIGLEMAHALKLRGYKVSVYEMLPQVFPRVLDPEIAQPIQDHMQNKGIDIFVNSKLNSIIGSEKVEGIEVNGEIKSTDLVIMATGVKPNSELLKDKVEMHRTFILVNEKMQTSDTSIYAGGDVIITKNAMSSDLIPVQLATTAAKHGIVAGINMAGGDASYNGAYGTFVSEIGGLEIAATGLVEEYARSKYQVVSAKAKGLDKPKYAGGEDIVLKLIASRTGEILGAQAIGKNAADKINVISMALKKHATINELSALELAYCPSVSELYDIINVAADMLLRKLSFKSYQF